MQALLNARKDMKAWESLLGDQPQQAYFIELMRFVEHQRASGKVVFPPPEQVFNAFTLTHPDTLKLVILGQDPYHGLHQAHGLSFSVQQGNKIPPSLRNIFQELSSDIDGFIAPQSGDLSAWAKQGVLLLNAVLTVEEGHAHSHKNHGWEVFTDTVIQGISAQLSGVIFLLWGAPAQKKASLIDTQKHHILAAPHPSPLSSYRGFFGCKHFSQANALLEAQGKQAIDWRLG